jgi:hypothetical protein
MSWAGQGLAAAAGSLLGLLAGGAIGASLGGRNEHGVVDRVGGTLGGATTGALLGTALGAFLGAAITAPAPVAAGSSTIVVNPGTNPPTPLPPAPPAPPGPPPPLPATPANDPILTDAQSIIAARGLLGQWWQQIYTSSPQTVNNQMYTPVTTLTGGAPTVDPYFVGALAFFQQFINANAQPSDFALLGLPITSLPYTNGTLDTYTLQLLQYASTHPNA